MRRRCVSRAAVHHLMVPASAACGTPEWGHGGMAGHALALLFWCPGPPCLSVPMVATAVAHRATECMNKTCVAREGNLRVSAGWMQHTSQRLCVVISVERVQHLSQYAHSMRGGRAKLSVLRPVTRTSCNMQTLLCGIQEKKRRADMCPQRSMFPKVPYHTFENHAALDFLGTANPWMIKVCESIRQLERCPWQSIVYKQCCQNSS